MIILGEIFHAPKIGLFLLVIACVLFDFSAQACFNPCESLIYDVCKGTSQESSCFFVYSFMTSFGKSNILRIPKHNILLFRWMFRLLNHCYRLDRFISW
jgi:hypothetical protein